MADAAPNHGKRLTRASAIRCLALCLSIGLLLPGPHNAGLVHAGSLARIAHYEPLNSLAIDSPVKPGLGKASISATTTVSFEAYGRLIVLDLVKNDRLVAKLRSRLPLREDQVTVYKGSIRSVPGSWVRLSIDENGIAGVVWDGTELLLIDQLGRLEGLQVAARDKNRIVVVRLADIELAIDERVHPATSAASMSAADLIGEATTRARNFVAGEGLTSRAISLGVVIDTALANTFSNIEQAAIGWANVADGIFTEQVDIHLDLEELINLNGLPDPFTSTNPSVLLSTLGNFKSSDARLAPLGLVHLMTRIDLNGLVRGTALFSSACGPSQGIGLTEARGGVLDALIMSHEIAHNLGAPHDNEFGSACAATPDGFLMAPTLNGSSLFSACSVNQMSVFLNTASCLVPVAFSEIQLDTPALPLQVFYKSSFPLELRVHNIGIESVVGGQVNVSGNSAFDMILASASNRDCFEFNWDSEVSCDLDNMYPGETVIVRTEISPQATGQQTLDILASAANDTDPTNNVASFTVDVIPATELRIDGFNLTNVATPQGGSVTYTLSVLNLGDLATTVVVQLRTAPDHSLEATANCMSPGAGQLDCDVGTLVGGGKVTFEFTVHVGADLGLGLSENLTQFIDVTLETSLHDTAIFPGTRFLFGVFGAFHDLDVGFSEPPVNIKQGESRELVAYVTNLGPDPVADLDLNVYIDVGVELGVPVADRGSCTLVGRFPKCRFGQFDPGEFVNVRIRYTGIDVKNYAMELFPDIRGGYDTSSFFPNAFARFAVTSSAPPPPPPPRPPPKSGGGGESLLWLLALLAAQCCRLVKPRDGLDGSSETVRKETKSHAITSCLGPRKSPGSALSPRVMSLFKPLLLLPVLACTVIACGGGGGDSAGPNPPPGGTNFGTLAFNQNSAVAVPLAVSVSEGALSFAQMAVNSVIGFASPSGAAVTDCGNTGSVVIDLQDSDSSFDVSSGDTVTITYTDCYDSIIDDIVNGTVTISVDAFVLNESVASLSGDLETTGAFTVTDQFDPNAIATLTADFFVDFALLDPETLLVQASGNQRFSARLDGLTETLTGFTLAKEATRVAPGSAAANVNTVISLELDYDSQALGGTFQCETTDFTIFGTRFEPLDADMICRGRSNSAARVVFRDQLQVDAEGDGSFAPVGIVQWSQVIYGFLGTDSQLVLADISADIDVRRFTMSTNDVIFDAARNRFLATTRATDPANPRSLVAIDSASNTMSVLATFNAEPNVVRISEDSSTLYLSFIGSNELRRYDAASMSLLATIAIQSDPQISASNEIVDMAVSPVHPADVAVTFRFLPFAVFDTILVQDDVQLPASYRDTVAANQAEPYDEVEYSADGTGLYLSRDSKLAVLAVDGNGVASVLSETRDIGRVSRIGNALYGSSAAFGGAIALDATSLTRLGSYVGNSWTQGIDAYNDARFSIDDGDLTVYQLDKFVPLAQFDTNLEFSSTRYFVPGPDKLLIVDEDVIRVVAVADLAVENTAGCPIAEMENASGETYQQYLCPVTDVIYDSVRDRVYAAIDSSLGVNGNSIAILNGVSGVVEQFVPIGSEPRQLVLSADGNKLYAIFSGAEKIVSLDLDTLGIVDDILIPPDTIPTAIPQTAAQRAMHIVASPVENDLVVVTIEDGRDNRYDNFVAFRTGQRLVDEIAGPNLQQPLSASRRTPFFDEAGTGYLFGLYDFSPLIETFAVGPAGLTLSSFYGIGSVQEFGLHFGRFQNELILSAGGVVDLATQGGENRFDLSTIAMNQGGGSWAVLADANGDDVYFVVPSINSATAVGIARFDRASGNLLAEEQFAGHIDTFYGPAIVDIGGGRLAIAASANTGMMIMEKSIID